MTDSSILQRYLAQTDPSVNSHTEQSDTEESDNLASFGWLRGIRDRALMLELRKKDGNILAFGYNWLERVDFDPSTGIKLSYPGHLIIIRGQYLNSESSTGIKLFEGLTRHKVVWIQEANRAHRLRATDQHPQVECIEWQSAP